MESALGFLIDHKVSVICLILAIVVLRVLRYPITRYYSTALNRRHSCQPAPKVKSADPLFGLDAASPENAVNSHSFLKLLPQIFVEAGSWTVEINQLGQPVV